jgi:7-cyano-7-deazaguanine synthase
MKKAVVLLSGGLDSATALYYAVNEGFHAYCLICDYGQRHRKEIRCAEDIARRSGSVWKVIPIALPWRGSALLDPSAELPRNRANIPDEIPATYVPSRNTIFLSFAMSWAEVIGAEAVFIGANALDYSGYPDCRPAYFEQIGSLFEVGTKAGIEGKKIAVRSPLIDMTKREIVSLGKKLGVPFELTWSCYAGGARPCGTCDSCLLRAKGFEEAGYADPAADAAICGTRVVEQMSISPGNPTAGRIAEIFRSVQGEGKYNGVDMIFIRFAGCNIKKCSYCDTAHESHIVMELPEVLRRVDALRSGSRIATVSITGGEPLLQADFLTVLFPALRERGLRILLETNGTLPGAFTAVRNWVDTVSTDIKLPSAIGGRDYWQEHEAFLRAGLDKDQYVKIIVGEKTPEEEFARALALVKSVDPALALFVQPETGSGGAVAVPSQKLERLFRTASQEFSGARLVPQIHKMLGIA